MPANNRHFIIRKPEVEAQTGFCGQHIGRLEKKGEFPTRIQLGRNSVGWWQDEIDQWLASRPRGAPKQRLDLAVKRAAPQPDAADLDLLHQLAAKYGLALTPAPLPTKPERTRRARGGP
jgi:prophage regulatory protein